MNWKQIVLWGAVLGAAGLLVSKLFNKNHKPNEPSPYHSLSDSKSWSLFGDADISAGSNSFTLTNRGGQTGFASAAVFLQNLLGALPDVNSTLELHLKVKGVKGAKMLGITAPKNNENPANVNFLGFSKMIDISDGLEHDLTFTLPQSSSPVSQVALHFGDYFGFAPMGNPAGSGVEVLSASLGVFPVTINSGVVVLSNVATVASSSSKSYSAGLSEKGMTIVSPTTSGSGYTAPNDPTQYVPLFKYEDSMDVTPLTNTQERLNAALLTRRALTANRLRLTQDASTKDHPVTTAP